MEQKNMEIDFATFLMSLASAAYCSLGIVPNPITKKTEKNLVLAKQQINLLELIKEKTKGNLNKDEEQLMESILYQLHMTYVKSTETKTDAGVKDNEGKKN
ncbi:MAG: DUF1844 domain-containing protein [Proteobacteria bacterium]|nr:DUF1844 domain-containing protein [Pseudomonadota bacterium]